MLTFINVLCAVCHSVAIHCDLFLYMNRRTAFPVNLHVRPVTPCPLESFARA